MLGFKFWKRVAVEIAVKNIQDVYQNCAIQRIVKKWFAKFKCDNFHLDYQPRFGLLSDTMDMVSVIQCKIIHKFQRQRLSRDSIFLDFDIKKNWVLQNLMNAAFVNRNEIKSSFCSCFLTQSIKELFLDCDQR